MIDFGDDIIPSFKTDPVPLQERRAFRWRSPSLTDAAANIEPHGRTAPPVQLRAASIADAALLGRFLGLGSRVFCHSARAIFRGSMPTPFHHPRSLPKR